MYSLIVRWISLAALSWRFHILVEETISSSLRVGNCFLNLMSICSCSFRKSSDSSTCPRTCLTSACRMSRQWILLPFAIGRLKLTNATILGLEIPNGGSRLAMKSLNCEKFMNCVACGSYLRINHSYHACNEDLWFRVSNRDRWGPAWFLTWTIVCKTSLNHPRQYRSPLPDVPD